MRRTTGPILRRRELKRDVRVLPAVHPLQEGSDRMRTRHCAWAHECYGVRRRLSNNNRKEALLPALSQVKPAASAGLTATTVTGFETLSCTPKICVSTGGDTKYLRAGPKEDAAIQQLQTSLRPWRCTPQRCATMVMVVCLVIRIAAPVLLRRQPAFVVQRRWGSILLYHYSFCDAHKL